ncbi:MAG: hypothetical protein KDB07_04955, partial [Planctomycetes bacterium]|nr:hypothetical protein [Planctomycetota bacterium]
IQVSDFLVQNWLRGDDYRPRGDDALISCVDLLVQHDASFEVPQPWLADLQREIISWFGEIAPVRRNFVYVQGLSWLDKVDQRLSPERRAPIVVELALSCLEHPHAAIRWRAAELMLGRPDALDLEEYLATVDVLSSSDLEVRHDATRVVLGMWAALNPLDSNRAMPFNPEASADTRTLQVLQIRLKFQAYVTHRGSK